MCLLLGQYAPEELWECLVGSPLVQNIYQTICGKPTPEHHGTPIPGVFVTGLLAAYRLTLLSSLQRGPLGVSDCESAHLKSMNAFSLSCGDMKEKRRGREGNCKTLVLECQFQQRKQQKTRVV